MSSFLSPVFITGIRRETEGDKQGKSPKLPRLTGDPKRPLHLQFHEFAGRRPGGLGLLVVERALQPFGSVEELRSIFFQALFDDFVGYAPLVEVNANRNAPL